MDTVVLRWMAMITRLRKGGAVIRMCVQVRLFDYQVCSTVLVVRRFCLL